MNSYSGMAVAALAVALGIACIVVVVYRFKKPRTDQLHRPSVQPSNDADRPR